MITPTYRIRVHVCNVCGRVCTVVSIASIVDHVLEISVMPYHNRRTAKKYYTVFWQQTAPQYNTVLITQRWSNGNRQLVRT